MRSLRRTNLSNKNVIPEIYNSIEFLKNNVSIPLDDEDRVTGVLSLEHGGTGATTIAGARAALNLGNSDGAVPITAGGTGGSTVAQARNNLGLGNTSGAVPIANGGTGATTVALARNALGLGNTSGAVPIANGGTGATTAANACANIGALPKSGGTMTGYLYAYNNTSYTTSQVRNIQASTIDLNAGTSALTSGTIYLVYE